LEAGESQVSHRQVSHRHHRSRLRRWIRHVRAPVLVVLTAIALGVFIVRVLSG
jgi:hypothetical protein